MFNFISKKIRSLIIDNNFIRKFILKTLSKNLYIPYEIYFIEKFNDEDKHLQMEYQNIEDEMMEDIVAFTCPYDDIILCDTHGYIKFSINAIKKDISELSYFESIKEIKSIVLHEIRHCKQFDFLRKVGGISLLKRVINDQKNMPYLDNILELDAYAYQLLGIDTDFEIVFADYL